MYVQRLPRTHYTLQLQHLTNTSKYPMLLASSLCCQPQLHCSLISFLLSFVSWLHWLLVCSVSFPAVERPVPSAQHVVFCHIASVVETFYFVLSAFAAASAVDCSSAQQWAEIADESLPDARHEFHLPAELSMHLFHMPQVQQLAYTMSQLCTVVCSTLQCKLP